MATRRYHLILLGALAVALAPSFAHATLLGDYFGVTPEVTPFDNGSYSAYQFDADSLVPTLHTGTVDYEINDWFGSWSQTVLGDYETYSGDYPSGEEPYDIEAYYFDDDDQNLYFAFIVGFPSPTTGIFTETRTTPDVTVTQGDFALDLPRVTGSQTDNWGFAYDYGVDLVDENRPTSGNVTSFASNTLGDDLYRTSSGWYLGTPNGAVNPVTGDESGSYTNFDPSYSGLTALGSVTTAWYQLNLTYGGSTVLENNAQTYVIEVTIPKSMLPQLTIGDEIGFQWLMGCRNDGSDETAYLTGGGDIDSPEPGTLALLLMGAGPLGMWARKQRRKQS